MSQKAPGAYKKGVRMHPTFWANYFKILQFCTRKSVYTPNSDPNMVIFLKIRTPLFKVPDIRTPFSKVCVRDLTLFLDLLDLFLLRRKNGE